MIIEMLLVLALVISGSSLLISLGMRGWALLPLGLLTGVSLFTLITYFFAITGFLPTILLPLGVCLMVPLFILTYRVNYGLRMPLKTLPTITALLLVVTLTVVFADANLAQYHFDSFRYLLSSSLLYDGHIESLDDNLLLKRFSTFTVIQSLGNLSGDFYFKSIIPLISVSTLASFHWIVSEGLKRTISRSRIALASILGLTFLASTASYIYHSFYLNGHLIFAVFFLMTAGVGWLMSKDKPSHPIAPLLTIQALSVSALVLSRPEGSLFGALAIAPSLLSSRLKVSQKAVLLASFGLTTIVQQGLIITIYNGINASIIGFLGLGIASLLAIPLLSWRIIQKKPLLTLTIIELAIWLSLAIGSFIKPAIFVDSLKATIKNTALGEGGWGVSLILLGCLLTITLLLVRFPNSIFIRFPITTFIPVAFMLGFLRGTAFRVGEYDSLNRIIIQVVPLIVLFIAISAVAGARRTWFNRFRPLFKR